MDERPSPQSLQFSGGVPRVIRFCLERRPIVFLFILLVFVFGVLVAPFDWELGGIFRDPVPVDAIPDIGENQQIVFTEWPGRSPQDMEDQVTYPLTVSLMGIPGLKNLRTVSEFGFSSIYVIFHDDVDFYWARSRILEKLNSLPSDTLPGDATPSLGPDATSLGQVFWYSLEGQDEAGNRTGGWDLHELRTIQDWHVRFALLSVEGVSEVASVGGFVQEYQVDVDPDLMRTLDVKIEEVVAAVKSSNIDVGAGTISFNQVEYVVRGIGFIKELSDLEYTVVKVKDGIPVFIKDVAKVVLGPSSRRGALDKDGAETAGGVVVVRYGENPLAVIKKVKEKIEEISPGLPKKTLPDGTISQVRIVPFYDRTGLIYETLGTLRSALSDEILVTIIVVLIMMVHLGSSLLISGLLPLAVLLCFIAMKVFGVAANIVALSGIAIAIGTIVDMGIILTENIERRLNEADPGASRREVIHRASTEVGGAILTSIATTVVSFLPVFTLEAAEGKLFRPLAFTKTFALVASLILALTIIPPLAESIFSEKKRRRERRWIFYEGLIYLGGVLAFTTKWWIGAWVMIFGGLNLLMLRIPERARDRFLKGRTYFVVVTLGLLLTYHWLPLGPGKGLGRNFLFVSILIGGMLLGFQAFRYYYRPILTWCLCHKKAFLSLPILMIVMGSMVWLGFSSLFGWVPNFILRMKPLSYVAEKFPGLGKEFMPPLDEGSYLFMPSTMPHASIGEALDIVQKQDTAIRAIPEVDTVVGKVGRAESPLDPAPVSMIETVINYKSEYLTDRDGKCLGFRYAPDEEDFFRNEEGRPLPAADGRPYLIKGRFTRDENNRLIPDPWGQPFRLWRPPLDELLNPGREPWSGIRKPDDIWDAIIEAALVPGTTSASRLQPISARMVMLQSGIRASMGVRIKGPDLETIEKVGLEIEHYLRKVRCIDPLTVIADRIIGKPYLEISIDRYALARYGLSLQQVQDVIEFAIGGKRITTTVEGRERFPVRVRYLRELRDDLESVGKILVAAPDGTQIPLTQLAEINYVRGPQMIKGEGAFLVGYVLFDKKPGYAEVDAVEEAWDYLVEEMEYGDLELPEGVSFSFTGRYESQVRSEHKLALILPVALVIIFIILYLQFKSVVISTLVFSSIPVAWAGGFIMIWLYGQSWFLDFSVFGLSLREVFQVHPINLSVAIWVGFLALFGIASDDGVVMTTYLEQSFSQREPATPAEIQAATVDGALRRIRPCLMTTATTILALIPVLTSTGRGSDIMVPMAIPSFGGMLLQVVTMLVVPVLYCATKEHQLKKTRALS